MSPHRVCDGGRCLKCLCPRLAPKTREPRPLPVRAPAWSLSIALLNAFFWRVPLAERTRTRRRWFLRGHRSRLECPTREKRRFFNCSFCLNHKALGARKPPISTMCARAGPVRVVQDLDKVPTERCVLQRGGTAVVREPRLSGGTGVGARDH